MGNDKLLPFGFGIHGLIDGYSKKILWLNVLSSNKNPKLIQTVQNLNFKTARIIRADKGTENGIVARIQRFFHEDDESSFLYGKSTANQIIEARWSFLRRSCLQKWKNLFKDTRDSEVRGMIIPTLSTSSV